MNPPVAAVEAPQSAPAQAPQTERPEPVTAPGGALAELQAVHGNRTLLRMLNGATATPVIQREAEPGEDEPAGVPESVAQELTASGAPLDPAAKAEMEARFGHDFASVRLHTGAQAAMSARAVSALAYTAGHHIVLGARAPAPRSVDGQRLLAHELAHVVQQSQAASAGIPGAANGIAPAHGVHEHQAEAAASAVMVGRAAPALSPAGGAIQRAPDEAEVALKAGQQRVIFARDEGLNLREAPSQTSRSLAKLKFGERLHTLDEPTPTPGWKKVATGQGVGYVYEQRTAAPWHEAVKDDLGLRLVKVRPGQTFWGLVKESYGIQGNESTPDKNINHFINAIRAVNRKEAFKEDPRAGALDAIGNWAISGRDASDTLLKAGVDIWIPSFAVASKMDVGSGTVTGEISRVIGKIEQKLADFRTAGTLAAAYIPEAILKRVGEVAEGLLKGLIKFALEAATILAVSTAVGALIGALFGGVGAVPGAEIGFEIGLFILQVYGLYELVEAVLGLAGSLVSKLTEFIQLVWRANGDRQQLDAAAKALADALGILASVLLNVLIAYVMKKGMSALSKTKFAATVGEKPLMRWIEQRQQGATTRSVLSKRTSEPAPAPAAGKKPAAPDPDDAAFDETFSGGKDEGAYQTTNKLARGLFGEKAATEALAAKGHTILEFKPDIRGTNQGGIDILTLKDGKLYAIDNKALSRGGNVSSVSALTTNYAKNLAAARQKFAAELTQPGILPERAAHLKQAIAAIDNKQVIRAVTNANVVKLDSQILKGVSQKLGSQGIQFIDVFK